MENTPNLIVILLAILFAILFYYALFKGWILDLIFVAIEFVTDLTLAFLEAPLAYLAKRLEPVLAWAARVMHRLEPICTRLKPGVKRLGKNVEEGFLICLGNLTLAIFFSPAIFYILRYLRFGATGDLDFLTFSGAARCKSWSEIWLQNCRNDTIEVSDWVGVNNFLTMLAEVGVYGWPVLIGVCLLFWWVCLLFWSTRF
tara:strand:- start:5070 stop:5669 length:600 start_codon:yes stop_codon:yes gene_type:complete